MWDHAAWLARIIHVSSSDLMSCGKWNKERKSQVLRLMANATATVDPALKQAFFSSLTPTLKAIIILHLKIDAIE